MGKRPSCRSCSHCTLPKGVEMGWCQLRRLPIHPELCGEIWCHHWTALPPKLPALPQDPDTVDQQLALTALLIEA